MEIVMQTKNAKFNFGWGKTWTFGFLSGGVIFLVLAIAIYEFSPSIRIAALLSFLISLNLFAGDAILRLVNRMTSELVLPFVDLFTSYQDLVLDAGCGHGRTSIAISKIAKKAKIVALDRFDANYIENGGKTLLEANLKTANITDRVKIVQGDVTNLKFDDNTFDTLVSSYMMDHLGEKKRSALKELNRVLKPGCKFLLVVIVRNYATFAIASFFSLFTMGTKESWRKLFRQTNFDLVEEGDINGGAYFLLKKPKAIIAK
jgi:ubiquinone/menaquinone biosynthesis C-methylase UbiE